MYNSSLLYFHISSNALGVLHLGLIIQYIQFQFSRTTIMAPYSVWYAKCFHCVWRQLAVKHVHTLYYKWLNNSKHVKNSFHLTVYCFYLGEEKWPVGASKSRGTKKTRGRNNVLRLVGWNKSGSDLSYDGQKTSKDQVTLQSFGH